MGLLVLILDRDVLAFRETMLVESIASLLVSWPIQIVVDHPGRSTGPARPVHQDALPVCFVHPEAPDPTAGSRTHPFLLIQPPLPVQGRGDLVAMPGAPLRELLAAGKMKRDVMEHFSLPGAGWVRQGPTIEVTVDAAPKP